MSVKLMSGLVVLLMVTPAVAGAVNDEQASQIMKKLNRIDQRLNRLEQDIRQLHSALGRLTGEKGPTEQQAPFPDFRKDPREIWQAMGDPAELTKRLNTLAESFAPTIPDQARREEFMRDIEALSTKIGQTTSQEELYEKARERLTERLSSAVNEREKLWLQRQLDALERSEGGDRMAEIDRYIRIENITALHELAKKHSIPSEQMVKCGLAFIGHGRRPPVHPGGPDAEGPPRVPPYPGPRPPSTRGRP